jgi:outer membrane protein TolC
MIVGDMPMATLDVALNLYKEGAVSYLEVMTAQTALLQA